MYYSLVLMMIYVLCSGNLLIRCVLDLWRGGEKNCFLVFDFDGWF